MTEAIPFKVVVSDEPQKQVMELLEMAVEMAKKGELRGVCVAGLLKGGDRLLLWGGEAPVTQYIGCLEMAKHQLIDAVAEIEADGTE